ncbi:MAG: AMP-binding protein [Marinilabiliaceae bacterium]|nr:AMP-binding protein [Marinilabiliaceae bacterium]
MIANKHKEVALVTKDRTISYFELKNNILQFQQLISTKQVNRIAIYSENRPEWIYAFYAGWYINNTVVPIDYLASIDDVSFILNDCFPDICFVSKNKENDLRLAIEKSGITTKIIILEEIAELPVVNAPLWNEIKFNDNDTAVIIYTSGTTGKPKGVMLSFGNLKANINAVSNQLPIFNDKEVVLMLLPLHHIFPLLGTLVAPLYVGAKIAISPSLVSDDVINTLQTNKVTLIIGVPRFYSAIHKGITDKINASSIAKILFKIAKGLKSKTVSKIIFKTVHEKFGGSIKYFVSGGAAIDKNIWDDFSTLGFDLLEGYGMTETAPMITFTRPDRIKIGSPGLALPGCKIAITNGEITVQGPNVMQGYFGRPDETAKIIRNGWLHTGDLGYIDKKGFLYITGRKKEILVLSNGKNINPVEIEDKLLNISELINDVGVYMERDQLRAVIVPDLKHFYNHKLSNIEQTIRWKVINQYNSQVSPYKKILLFSVYTDELPRTRLGKLQRFKLAELGNKRSVEKKEEVIKPIDLPEYDLIKNHIEREKNCSVRQTDHIEMDLGLDSLDKVGLQAFIDSAFGIHLETIELTQFSSIIEMSEFVAQKRIRMVADSFDWTKILKEKINIKLPKTWFTGTLVVKLFKQIFRILFNLKGKGLTNIPDGPCIIAPNHQSFFDGLFVASFLKNKTIRNTYFYAKEKHISSKWLKYLANRHHIIIMDLNKDLKQSIQKMGEALKKQKNLIIFPEGTRTRDGYLGDFKKTFAILSRELNIPIIPVSIKGAYDVLPRGARFPKPFKKVSVEFLEAVYPENSSYDALSKIVFERILTNQQF